MAIIDKNSRYATHAETAEVIDENGDKVLALGPARRPTLRELGEHILREGQRLDHLANYYLKDPHGYWKICELNDVLLPDQLAEVELVKIPTPF
jgi:hypothetical protein